MIKRSDDGNGGRYSRRDGLKQRTRRRVTLMTGANNDWTSGRRRRLLAAPEASQSDVRPSFYRSDHNDDNDVYSRCSPDKNPAINPLTTKPLRHISLLERVVSWGLGRKG